MLFGLQWYWWLVLAAVVIVFKVKLLKWWSRHRQERPKDQGGKWGEEE